MAPADLHKMHRVVSGRRPEGCGAPCMAAWGQPSHLKPKRIGDAQQTEQTANLQPPGIARRIPDTHSVCVRRQS